MTNSKKTLLLFLLSPITWYSAPVISPIIISSLFFLWGYFFRKSRVILSGILIGISIALWNSVIFILFFMLLCFFYDKKFYELLIFLLAVFIGFLPLVLLDYFLYGIPFYSLLKFIFGTVVIFTSGSIYGGAKQAAGTFLDYIYFIAFLPAFAFVFFKKNIFEKNKREIIFISITILFFFLNPQIRYLFFLWPIIIILLSDSLNDKQFKIQSIIFSAITIIVIILYIFTSVPSYSLKASMNKIAEQYPNESFIVGNNYDDYTLLALAYWGNDVKEFISIQDYEMYLENSTILYEKKIISTPKIQERRRIWVGGGLLAAEDNIDYDSVNFVLGIGEPVAIENFTFIKNYGEIYLSKRK